MTRVLLRSLRVGHRAALALSFGLRVDSEVAGGVGAALHAGVAPGAGGVVCDSVLIAIVDRTRTLSTSRDMRWPAVIFCGTLAC